MINNWSHVSYGFNRCQNFLYWSRKIPTIPLRDTIAEVLNILTLQYLCFYSKNFFFPLFALYTQVKCQQSRQVDSISSKLVQLQPFCTLRSEHPIKLYCLKIALRLSAILPFCKFIRVFIS